MHSCGKVNEIIEPLIEIGLDVHQPAAAARPRASRRSASAFAGRICFESLCDIQTTLPFKGATRSARRRGCCSSAGPRRDGGFILSDYGDGEAIGVPLWKKQIMLDAFREFDPYRS